MPEATRERAILVGLELRGRLGRRAGSASESDDFDSEESIEELAALAGSAGAEILSSIVQSREAPEAATLIGSGKLDELRTQAEAIEADVVIFDRDLSPTQLRNLEKALPCRVVDRTQLILDIFASAGAYARGPASGGTRATQLSVAATHGARRVNVATRRRNRYERPWRNAARNRPQADRRQDSENRRQS